MPSKFEQMRHRENRRMRANFYQTDHNMHMSNQKIRNDHYKFDAMRHRENRRIRNHNWDPANAKGFFTKTIPSIFNSATKGLLGGGGRGGGGGSSDSERMEGGPEGVGAYGGGAGSGGMSESGSIANPDSGSTSPYISDSDGKQPLPLIISRYFLSVCKLKPMELLRLVGVEKLQILSPPQSGEYNAPQ